MIDQNSRPVYISFEMRAVEDRAASINEGHYVAKDVAYVIVTPPGGNLKVEAIAEEWLARKVNDPFINHYRASFDAWLKGQEIPEYGTPIRAWPAISPAQAGAILAAGIRTVEDLATATDAVVVKVGMGARALQDKAQAWLQAAEGPGKLAEEVATLRRDNEALLERLATLTDEVTRLSALEPKVARAKTRKETEDA